ncbi:hypothetical protein LEN26_016930 [Aphanomyces euteiches]|nr:hypothetical protein LEN26_016930 [Aphanomyces euteiches]KAH9112063.1 hypothetical protein AeMF1_013547 [Aphanomyces euteiches]KAH9186695.1 hypothetical protein AeNC1_011328 [Aphanomyces euteiches]
MSQVDKLPLPQPASAADATRIGFFWGFLMLVAGTLCTIVTKAQYGIRAQGTESCIVNGAVSKDCLFDKPWFGVLEMKLGMAGCLAVVWIQHLIQKRKNPATAEIISVSWNTIVWFLVPSALDLLCTVFANVGLLWITSSIHQMTKGSLVIFNAVILVQFMGKRLFAYQYMSIGLVVLAITLVAYVGVLHSTSAESIDSQVSHANQVLGFACVVLSQFVTAWQYVVEEWLLTERQVNPAVLVGWEGLWGLIFFIVLGPLLTLTAPGSSLTMIWHEDFIDSLVKLSNSPSLVGSVLLFCVCTGIYNFSASCVTKYLTSVMSSFLDTARALGIWVAALFLYYVAGWTSGDSAGEPWTPWSWLELTGFIVLAVGTLMYKKVIRLPIAWLYEAEENELYLEEKTPLITTA